MDITVFSQAKEAGRPEDNEDRHLAIDGRAYAVIDGVTDKTGRRFGGLTGGQIAGRTVESALRKACAEREVDGMDGAWLIDRINREFAAAYRTLGLDAAAVEGPAAPFAAQLALALFGRDRIRFLIVGDAGLRLDGREVFRRSYPMDVIGAAIRKAVWRHVLGRGVDMEIADLAARAYTVAGVGALLPEAAQWIGERDLADLRRRVANAALEALPEVSSAIIEAALAHGMREQHRYANRLHPLGFPILDGRPVPPSMLVEFTRPRAEVDTIELFTDGYFGCPDGTTLDDWEAWFARVEAEDPAKIGRHASTKGSMGRRHADDRTVIIVRSRRADRPGIAESRPDDVRAAAGAAAS